MAVKHRDDIYTIGPPATEPHPGLVSFADDHAGASVLDVGCGTGAYTEKLAELGRAAKGIELNPEYVAEARARGVDAQVVDAGRIPFDDDTFDTTILFEVIEHIPDYVAVVREAFRVARKNVLITVPNVGEYEHLARYGLTYWHMVTTDHVNFFSAEDLMRLGADLGARTSVRRTEPLVPAALLRPRRPLWFAVSALRRLGIVKPVAYRRLHAILEKPANAS